MCTALLACVQFTILSMERVPCSLIISKLNKGETKSGCGGTGQDRVKESAEIRKCKKKKKSVSVLCPTGLELGSRQGSHYMQVSDSSLSHYTSRKYHHDSDTSSLNADYIISHHTHFNSCCCCFRLQCIKQNKLIKPSALHLSAECR